MEVEKEKKKKHIVEDMVKKNKYHKKFIRKYEYIAYFNR